MTPESVLWGTVAVGSPGEPKVVTLTNAGSTAITINSISVSGNDSADFTISNKTCGTSVAAGSSCNVTILFTPAAAGTRSAVLTFEHSGINPVQTVSLSGTGGPTSAPGSLSVSPSALVFGTVSVGSSAATQPITVQNSGTGSVSISGISITGTNAGDFSISTNTCGTSVAGSATCNVEVIFAPTASGTRTATLTLTDSAGNSPQTVALSGTGNTAASGATVSPGTVTFAATTVGTTAAAQPVTLSNGGQAAITISSIAMVGANAADFAVSSKTCGTSLAAAASCNISVTFSPSGAGIRSAVLTFTDSASNSPQTVALIGTGTMASITVNPASLTFATTALGSTSAAQSVTVANGGPVAVSFSSIGIAGAASSDFTIQSNTCGSSLASSASCAVSITFTPSVAGTRAAVLTFTDSAGNSPQTVTLAGSGTATNASVSPASLAFAATGLKTSSAAQSITLTNGGPATINLSSITITGTDAGDFAISSKACGASLAASASCVVSIAFTPTAAGARAATLTFTDTANNSPQTVALSGMGAASNATVNPASLSFAITAVGSTSAAQSVTLSNGGPVAINLTNIAISGSNAGDFAISSKTCGASLAALASCTVAVTFSPTTFGARTAALMFTDTAGNSPQAVALSGTGAVLSASVNPSSLAFGGVAAGSTSAPQPVTLSNTSATAINITSIVVSGADSADFTISSNTCGTSLAVSASCTVSVAFTPSITGDRAAMLTFTDGAGNSPQTVALSGSGTSPSASASPTSLYFPVTAVGVTSGSQTVTLTNGGTVAVGITSIAFTGANAKDFAIASNTCGTNLPASGSCTVTVTFTPAASGSRAATLNFTDAAGNSPQRVSLSGTGGSSPISVSPLSLTFPPTAEGATSAGQNATLTNSGTAAVSISSIGLTGAGVGDFAIVYNTCGTSIAANSSCTISVVFKPVANGPLTANLVFTDAAVGSPQIVALSGNGGTATFSIEPTNPSVPVNDTLQFTATAPVTWTASCGTIDATTGLYTAPSNTGSCTVTATDGGTPPSSVSTKVTVTNGASSGTLKVYPSTAAVAINSQQVFQAQLSGVPDANSLSYSIDGISGGNATVGTVTNQGLYTAPASAGTHTVTVKDNSLGTTATATITVFAAVTVDFGSRASNANPVAAGLFGAQRLESMRTTADLDLITSGGITYGRLYALIPTVFQTSTPDWSAIDSTIQRVTASGGVRIIVEMFQTPPWLQPASDECGTGDVYALPTDLNAWGSIAAQYVKHFDTVFPGAVTDYEIWNEPNTGTLCVDSSVRLSDYMALYSAAAPQMKAQARADGATIRVGGPVTAGLDPTWITAMLNDPVISQNIDFTSYHQYLFGPTQLGAQWDTYNGVESVYQATQDDTTGPAPTYEYAASLVAGGKQPQGSKLPIYLTEYNLNWQFAKDCCRNDFTYGPVWNGLYVADLLNAVYAYTGAPNTMSHLVYYAASAPPYFCLAGEYDANMDCSYPAGSVPQPYPQYFTYQLMGSPSYLGLQNGGYMANSISPPTLGNGLVVTAFFTPNLDAIVVINPSQYTYTGMPVNIVNAGFASPQATLYQIVSGSSIQTSAASLQSQGGNSYTTTIDIGPYSVQAISIHP